MSNVDTSKLRELAQAATPGPWRNGADVCHFDSPEVTDDKTFSYYVTRDNDAAFIAVANPTALLSLLDELDKLRALLDTPWVDAAELLPALRQDGLVRLDMRRAYSLLPPREAIALGAALIRAAVETP